jgi:hypothetical protein
VANLREELGSTELLIRLVGMVVAEAKAKGDERWKVADEQLQPLQDKRASLLKLLRKEENIPEPESTIINCTVGTFDAVPLSISKE